MRGEPTDTAGASRRARPGCRPPSHGRALRSGFTLVELLVVLAVVTILAAFLVPVLWSARNRANSAACVSNLRQLGVAVQAYTQDWDDTLPDAPGDGFAGTIAPSSAWFASMLTFPGLRGHGGIRASQSTYVRGQLSGAGHLADGVFRCPNDVGAPQFGYANGSVYAEALTSYLWDPAAQSPEGAPMPPPPGVSTQTVNGLSLDEIENPTAARLLQDYGALWPSPGHSSRSRSRIRFRSSSP